MSIELGLQLLQCLGLLLVLLLQLVVLLADLLQLLLDGQLRRPPAPHAIPLGTDGRQKTGQLRAERQERRPQVTRLKGRGQTGQVTRL